MLGVTVNTLTVIVGSVIGLLARRSIPKKVVDTVMLAIGLCTVYIGIDGMLSGENMLVIIASMALGAAVGTLINIDEGITRLGDWVEKRASSHDGKGTVARGFVTASLLFCVGAMTITGSIESGLTGDHSIIFTKSLLDFISSIMLSASLGVGVICAAAFVFVFQGALVLMSGAIAPFMTQGAINEITCVGSILILGLGLNILGITKLKVSDYLPAIVLAPVLHYLAQWLSAAAQTIL